MKWIIRNIKTFTLAFALAVIVWISAVSTSDPTVTRTYPQSIPLEVTGLDPSLVVVGSLPQAVNISLMAPISVWDEMGKQPGELRAIVDLSGKKAGSYTVRVQPQVTFRPAQITSISLQSVDLVLEEQATSRLPITVLLRGEPATGYKAGTALLDVREAAISGPRSIIQRAVKAQVQVSISGLRQDVQTEQPIVVLDKDNRVLDGISVLPATINVNQPIIQLGGYRDIAVKVNLRGQQAGGYRINNISVFPPIVTVYSQTPALVADMPGFVETEPFNLNGESADINVSIPLVLPAGVEVIGEQTINVQVGISAIEGSLALKGLPVETVGLETGMAASFSPPTVDLIITGPLPILDSLKSGDIKIILDLTGLAAGMHKLAPSVQIALAEIHVQTINPGTIEVVIAPAGANTPTPTP